jgi:enamine deaminase RidA (YjgF/YER057c/UK114 family)
MATKFNNPSGLAKGTYSHTASVTGGTTIHVSGQVAMNAKGEIVGSTFAEQTEQVFENLRIALEGAGAGFGDIVKMNIYVRDLTSSRVAAFREIRKRYLGDHQPASTLVGTTGLVHEDMMIEVEVVAVVD